MTSNTGYTSIISAEELKAYLGQPDWVIVDCRFDLSNPDWGFGDYLYSHIPGAVYAHLDYDLSGPRTALNGRHPLPESDTFREKLGRLGIDRSKQVVVYDTTGGSFAARLWWLLKYYGHDRVAVLDGGYSRWRRLLGYPTESGNHTNSRVQFTGAPDHRMVATTGELQTLSAERHILLIDARAPERFRGEVEPLDPVAGHIPGSVNRFHGLNLDQDGQFLPAADLRAAFLSLLGSTPPEKAVVYCGSGVTSAHHLVAMAAAGLPLARLYAGSWSEWIRDPSRPIARGSEI